MSNMGPFSPGQDSRGEPADQATSSNALRDALRSLGASGGRTGAVGNLSPQQLSELAQRAGLPGGMADLARISGLDLGAQGGAPAPATGPQYVVFAIGDLEACVPPESVQMVERLVEITPVPNTAAWVLGVVQLRGSVISVVDFAGFLGLGSTQPTQRTRLLVITHRGMTIGFVVDAVLEMRADATGMRSADGAPLPDVLAPYCSRVLVLSERSIALIDVQRLLFSDELHQYRSDAL